jgi:hypothetical protein
MAIFPDACAVMAGLMWDLGTDEARGLKSP